VGAEEGGGALTQGDIAPASPRLWRFQPEAGDAVYEAKSSSGCVLLEHKTCNVSLDGLVRTGTLETCESLMTNVKVQGRTNTPTRARP
jgi:hypothetical protein